jgi:hypothetical protein
MEQQTEADDQTSNGTRGRGKGKGRGNSNY